MSDKELLAAVSPSKPVNEMTDEELDQLVDEIWSVAAERLRSGSQ